MVHQRDGSLHPVFDVGAQVQSRHLCDQPVHSDAACVDPGHEVRPDQCAHHAFVVERPCDGGRQFGWQEFRYGQQQDRSSLRPRSDV